MKVSKTQLVLIQIAMGSNVRGMFYPHNRQWNPVTSNFVDICGAKYANAIRAMIRSGRAKGVEDLNPYAFILTDEMMAAYDAGEIEV